MFSGHCTETIRSWGCEAMERLAGSGSCSATSCDTSSPQGSKPAAKGVLINRPAIVATPGDLAVGRTIDHRGGHLEITAQALVE